MKQNLVFNVLVKFVGVFPVLSELIDPDVSRLLTAFFTDKEHFFLLVIVNIAIITNLFY